MLWTVLTGARIFMDNMLYIIAGLVIILLIGVWILRKNKAQRPTNQSIRQDGSTPLVAPVPHSSTANASTSRATMFDDITVAQRFIDQQRYDKAIETLERGLGQKPNDSALSLKLLNVYALSHNNEAFYNTYAAITAHGDVATIAQASQLKELLDEEQGTQASMAFAQNHKADIALESVDTPNDSIATYTPAHHNRTANANDVSLDFDFPTSTTNHESATIPNVGNNINHQDNTSNNIFDLTLDDLEATDEPEILEQSSLLKTANNKVDDSALEFDSIKNGDQIQPVIDSSFIDDADVPNESDFELDFESLLDDVVNTETLTEQDDTFIDDDFILSSDEDEPLVLDIENKPSIDDLAPSIEKTQTESVDNDFSLFLDDVTNEDAGFDVVGHDNISTSSRTSSESLHNVQTTVSADVNAAHENTLTFGDDTDIEALDFSTDSNETVLTESTSSPVLPNEDNNIDSSTNFAAQFAADFAFVDTLDSNQITLDLADQYLQLGEYDSAKRLLEEVVAQGNPEQQQKAEMLLARTA